MTTYAIYSFEVQEGNRSIFYKETGVKAIDMANTIIGNLLKDGLTIIGKKRKQDQPLKNLNVKERNEVFTWVLCNVKEVAQYEGHEKNTLESHPGSFIIFDNRPDVCQIAIEQNSAFYSDTDKVVKYIRRAFNSKLSDYGLKIVIKRKYQAGKFKELVLERLVKHNDSVKRIVWEFPNPDKVKGIDADQKMKNRLEGMSLLTQATKALKGKIVLTGSKGNPLCVDDDKIEDLAQIIALSAQNGYKLAYHFYNSSVINFKDVAYAFHSIDGKFIRDFENGQLYVNERNETTYELIEVLDRIREEIADYHEHVFGDEE